MKLRGLFAAACLLLTSEAVPAAGPVERLVLVSLDGLRPDAITVQDAPRLHAALDRAVYTLQAQNTLPSITLPNHASMLSGLAGREHGVTWNSLLPGRFARPTLFDAVAEQGGRSGAFIAKRKLAWLFDPAMAAVVHVEPKPSGKEILEGRSARNIAAAFRRAWEEKPFTFAFVHLREPDKAGHKFGWMSPEYLQAVHAADAAVGTILDTVQGSETAVVITADHGGHGEHHEQGLAVDRTIPWIVLLPGRVAPTRISVPVRIEDTAPTIAALLGLPWRIAGSGRVVSRVMEAADAKRYPPPAPGTRPAAGLPGSAPVSP